MPRPRPWPPWPPTWPPADSTGLAVRAPSEDDEQPNFAYFVYDGAPAWQGAIQPGSADPARGEKVLYDASIMESLPIYHLISREAGGGFVTASVTVGSIGSSPLP